MTKNGKLIVDAMGQWKHPGKPTRVPSNDITMMGVKYPVLAKPNKGKATMMYPGENYFFPGADYVDEYPMMQVGGTLLQPITAKDISNFFSLFSVPQKLVTKAVTGKYQTPSEAMGIKNPYGAFATDAMLDPVNLVGAGLLGKAAKASTKTGILSNTYKYNPLAFKPNAQSYYRMIGKEGYEDALKSGVVRPPKTQGLATQHTNAYYNKGYPLDIRFRNTTGRAGYEGPYMVEVKGNKDLFVNDNPQGFTGPMFDDPIYYSNQNIPINNPDVKFYKENWLQGYKKVSKKESGGQHGGLDRWFAEKWVDVKTGKTCGRQEGESRKGYPACRPSRRVNEDTPKTASELSSAEREKFKRSKTSSERINYQHRRKELGGEQTESDMANKPNNPALWSRAKSLAKQKFDVYPSAYANGWAAKWYKGKGGTWRTAEYGMEVPMMADGGKPEWLVEAQLKAQGYSGNALQQKMATMAKGGEPQNEGFQALPPYVQAKILSNMAYGGMAYPFMEEGGEPNGEMALGQMAAVSDKMAKLLQFVKPDDNVDPWIASKLAVMDHSADAISDYMMYGAEGDEEEAEEMETEEMKMGGIPQRYKNMGFNKVGVKKNSTRPGKKWMVLAKKGDQYKVVHGGYDGMKDFSQHGSEKRKANFWNRMGGKNSSKATDPFSPLYWHKRFGTWAEGGETDDMYEMKGGGSTWSGNAWYQAGGGVSIVDYLNSMGMASDKASRKQLAEKMGITNYDYSADKNLELLSMLRNEGVKDAPPRSTRTKTAAPTSRQSSSNIPALLRAPSMLRKGFNPTMNPEDLTRAMLESYVDRDKKLESGFVVDKRSNKGYVVKNGKIEKSFPVITGFNPEGNENPYRVSYLDNRPELRVTPAGTYNMVPSKLKSRGNKSGTIYGAPGYFLDPIPAFGEKKVNSKNVAIHTTYDPASRDRLYDMSPKDRYKSYGCINCRPGDIGSLTENYFPQGDTLMVIDPRKNMYDQEFLQRIKSGKGTQNYKMGGMPCYECGGMFAYGGYIPEEYAQGGIYIDPKKKGTFKAQATRMGMGVQEAASAILNAPEGKYSPEMRRKANFARNFAKQDGGLVQGAEIEVTPEQAEMLRQQGYDFEII